MTEATDETTLNLQITTTDAALLKDLMEGAGDNEGASVAIGDGGSLMLTRHRRSRAWGQPEVIISPCTSVPPSWCR